MEELIKELERIDEILSRESDNLSEWDDEDGPLVGHILDAVDYMDAASNSIYKAIRIAKGEVVEEDFYEDLDDEWDEDWCEYLEENRVEVIMEALQKIMNERGSSSNMTDIMGDALRQIGLDLDDPEAIDGFMEIMEPYWIERQNREKELDEQQIEVFREAGATDVQLAWRMVKNIPLSKKQSKKLDKIQEEIKDLHAEMLVLGALAATLNEARKKIME